MLRNRAKPSILKVNQNLHEMREIMDEGIIKKSCTILTVCLFEHSR